MGILNPVVTIGVFLPVDTKEASEAEIRDLISSPEGWQNYRTSEDDPETTMKLLQHMVEERWAVQSDM